MLIILATIQSLTTPTGSIFPEGSPIHLAIFNILLGIGVGGDHPLLATVNFDRANLRKRNTMLTYINDGCCSFVCSSITIIVLACYKDVMEAVKCQKEVNTTFWGQHYERLIGVSFPPSLSLTTP